MNYGWANNIEKSGNINTSFNNVLEKSTRTSSKYHSTSTTSTNQQCEQKMKSPLLEIDPKTLNEYLALSLILEPQSRNSHSLFDKHLANNIKNILLKNLIDEISQNLLMNMAKNLDISQIVKEACDITPILNQDSHCQNTPARKKKEKTKKAKNPSVSSKKHKVNICCHKDKPHYAKGLCKNCYHKEGRQKLAFKCEHIDRQLYAFGICKQCYQSRYSKNRIWNKKKSKSQQVNQLSGNEGIEAIRKANINNLDCTKESNENFISNDFQQMCENFSNEVEQNYNFLDKINCKGQMASNISYCISKEDRSKSNIIDLQINDNELNMIDRFEDNSFLNVPEKSNSSISNYSEYLL